MRFGIISDIHSNWEALKVVLKALKKEKTDKYICLGDVVGYGPDPRKCTDKIRKLTDHVIAGNHDHAALGLTSIENFNHWAQLSTVWTGDRLKKRHKAYLQSLSLTWKLADILFVHSTPINPEQWNYILSTEQAEIAFSTFSERICFIGHSHHPVIFRLKNGVCDTLKAGKIKLSPDARYIINTGSVGQPRDGNNAASFCIYDTEESTIDIRRLTYPVERTQIKIIKAGLPEYLADRLAKGR